MPSGYCSLAILFHGPQSAYLRQHIQYFMDPSVSDKGICGEDITLLKYATSQLVKANNVIDLNDSISLLRRAKARLHPNGGYYPDALNNLASALSTRYTSVGRQADLEEAIVLQREIIKLRNPSHPGRAICLHNLASTLMVQYKQAGRQDDLKEAISIHRQALKYFSARDPNRCLSLTSLADALRIQYIQGGQPDNLNEAISLCGQALELRPSTHPGRWMSLRNLANVILIRFAQNGRRSDLEEAISLHRQALTLHSSPKPDNSSSLNKLAAALIIRFEQDGKISDLDEAIAFHRRSLELCPPPNVERPIILGDLASALSTRFQHGGRLDDLIEAVGLNRQALKLLPRHNRPRSLNNLANALCLLVEEDDMTHRGDLDEAVSSLREALAIFPPGHSNRFTTLHNLANALVIKAKRLDQGHQGHLNEAISLFTQVLQLRPAPHPDRFMSLVSLAHALLTKFYQEGHSSDLNEVISLYKKALDIRPSLHSNRCLYLYALADALSVRYKERGQQKDLNEAVSLYRQALEILPTAHPRRVNALNGLAIAVLSKFEQGGQLEDLEEAIVLYNRVLELCPPSHSSRYEALNGLAIALCAKFEKGNGQRDDLDKAISLHRQAFELRPPPHPDCVTSLNNLASTLSTRYGYYSQKRDLDEIIESHRRSLKFLPLEHPKRLASLNNLASALSTKFSSEARLVDINESIELSRQALVLLPPADPPRPDRPRVLTNLACALCNKVGKVKHQEGLDEATSLLREALSIFPAEHPDRSNALVYLADALFQQVRQGGPTGYLTEAIALHKEALERRPSPHPGRSDSLACLGNLYMYAYSLLQDPGDDETGLLDNAMSSYSAAIQCPCPSLSRRFSITDIWSDSADKAQHSSAIVAYDSALQHLSELASLSLDVQSRQEILRARSDGLARKAALYAIRHGHYGKAIEYLESGRAIFWSRVLHLRSPLDKLCDVAPELGKRLREIANELENSSHRITLVDTMDNRTKMGIEAKASQLAGLDEEWKKGVDDARKMKGFEDFLRPLRLESLHAGASECPIVVLIPDDSGSDCLIMTLTNVQHIHLPALPTSKLRFLVKSVKLACSQTTVRRALIDESALPSDMAQEFRDWLLSVEERASRPSSNFTLSSDNIFKAVLKTLWEELVKPLTQLLGIQKSENPQKLQWCPTGLFTFLPIHAAGCYDGTLGDECASDFIVSSYTPTIETLLPLNEASTAQSEPFKMMVVVDAKRLRSALVELGKIKSRVPNDGLTMLGSTPDVPALVDTVYFELSTTSIAHFACHGIQNRSNPLDSSLLMDDGQLKISKIMQRSLPNGSLAFLCACETAMGDANVPDEALSLGASMLFSGFRSAVATMWKMADADGPTIADVFYEELFRGSDGKPAGHPDLGKSSQALHVAVKKLRSSGVEFRRWVPFIHLGK